MRAWVAAGIVAHRRRFARRKGVELGDELVGVVVRPVQPGDPATLVVADDVGLVLGEVQRIRPLTASSPSTMWPRHSRADIRPPEVAGAAGRRLPRRVPGAGPWWPRRRPPDRRPRAGRTGGADTRPARTRIDRELEPRHRSAPASGASRAVRSSATHASSARTAPALARLNRVSATARRWRLRWAADGRSRARSAR